IRASEFGIPSVWLPDIEPDASNTIIASSVQGVGFLSSAGARTGPTERRRSEARAPRATCRTMVDDLPGNRRDIAQRSRTFMPNLAEKSSADLSRAAACGLGKKNYQTR